MMEKREMKLYEAPVVEIVEMEVSAPLLDTSFNPPTLEEDDPL